MPAATPPYIPKFGAGAPTTPASQGTIYFDTSDNNTPYIRNNGVWNRTSIIYTGTALPTFIAPVGALYSRSGGTPHLYQSNPTAAAATIVQSAQNSQQSGIPGSVTFGGAVTPGNLVLAWVGYNPDDSAQIDATKWNILDTSNAGLGTAFPAVALLYRYAQVGDTATIPPVCVGGTNKSWFITAVEVNNVTGNINTDILSHTVTGVDFFTDPLITPAQSTTTTNQLCLIFYAASGASAIAAMPAGYATVLNTVNNVNYGTQFVGSQTPGSGVNIGSNSITKPVGSNSNRYAEQIIFRTGLAPAWTLLI